MNTKDIRLKCKKIKLVITDVDGVLTDGGMYYSEEGEVLKKFNTKDGMAVELLKSINIKTIFITRENSKISIQRAKKVKSNILSGILRKELELSAICKKFKVLENQIAYVGDDVNDYEIMQKVGFSACPNDAHEKIKKISMYCCSKNGSEGVLREVADLIMNTNILKNN